MWNVLSSTFWSSSTPGICSYVTSPEKPSLTSSSFRRSFPCFPHGIFYHCHYFIYCLFLSMFIFLTRIGVSWWRRNSCLWAIELQDLEPCPIHDRHSIFYFFFKEMNEQMVSWPMRGDRLWLSRCINFVSNTVVIWWLMMKRHRQGTTMQNTAKIKCAHLTSCVV